MQYKHMQPGYLILSIMFILTVYFLIILRIAGFEQTIVFAVLLILLILASFTSLKVWIDDDDLRIKFGYGIFKKRFSLQEIASVSIVKNKWYYGWGIRFWPKPRMVIFNISGYDAIELKMRNNRTFRIGTDEPKLLEKAIKHALKK